MIAVHARAPFSWFNPRSATSPREEGSLISHLAPAHGPISAVPIYSMAKAVINNLTHALAIELGPCKITVNAVAPGWIRTDMSAAVRESAEMVKAIQADTAHGRLGETSDVAAVVVFLAATQCQTIGERESRFALTSTNELM